MKRSYRILKIWIFGKLNYAKRVRRWMKWQIIRDLYATETPERIIQKYSSMEFKNILDYALGKNNNPTT